MFVWDSTKVLAAFDAGINEVISTYNSSFTYFVREGWRIADCHGLAMTHTIAWLHIIEMENVASAKSVYDLVDAMAYEYNASNGYSN